MFKWLQNKLEMRRYWRSRATRDWVLEDQHPEVREWVYPKDKDLIEESQMLVLTPHRVRLKAEYFYPLTGGGYRPRQVS